jgi:hypothetical protein
MLAAALTTGLITLLNVGFQVAKTTAFNPTQSLRSE